MNINLVQPGFSDCGPACLAAVAAYYGLFVSVSDIRKYANTHKKGTNIIGLISAAKKIGLDAIGVKGTLESLKYVPKPVIAHLQLGNSVHHFVTIIDLNDLELTIMDPALGKTKTIMYNVFRKQWTGVLVILRPNSCFQSGDFRSVNGRIKLRSLFRVFIIAAIAFLIYLLKM